MASLYRGSRLIRAVRCPKCHQAWLRQRHAFSTSANLHRAVLESKEGQDERSPKPQRTGLAALRQRSKAHKGGSLGAGDAQTVKIPRFVLGQNTESPIRTRFAPSPTGYLHLGSLRTALFNNLASAASNGGSFILRVEDTDQSRLVGDAEERILNDLRWLGLNWSEGPDCGGPHGPYRQSERLEIYKEHVQHLIDEGYAYRCFCKPEDLDQQKRLLHEAGKPTFYPGTCRSVGAQESAKRAAAGEPHVVRFRGDAFGIPKFKDAIYGPFQKKEAEEDFIILKTDGYPTYHLANVVDDHLMKITHVVRGEEWLISTPKHLALYQAFGWAPPTFAHLGLLTNDDGSKLSKRNDGANVSTYQENGYSPMAMQAWLANLGSSFKNPSAGTPRTIEDLASVLSFKFTKGGIKLNLEKLDDFEVKYHRAIVQKPLAELADQEAQLIEDKILRPMLAEVDRLTSASPEAFRNHAGLAWEQPKELVPMLASGERLSYARRIFDMLFRERYKKRGDMQRLVVAHPHYFWRVPAELYRRELAAYGQHTERVLAAIREVCNDPRPWDVDSISRLERAMKGHLGEDFNPLDMYMEHRFVATGQHLIPTHNTGSMFAILGRDEWEHRVQEVSRLKEELNEGGSETKKRWLQEAWEKDPEAMRTGWGSQTCPRGGQGRNPGVRSESS